MTVESTALNKHWKCVFNYRADAIIRADWRITTWQLALQLSISTGSVCSIIETQIFECLLKVGPTKSHSRPQDPEENHFFWIVRAFWCWGRGLFVPDRYRRRNLGTPFCARDKKAVSGVASSSIAQKEEIQDSSFCRKSHGYCLLGLWWSHSCGCDAKRCDH
jgi:hypothetical protein